MAHKSQEESREPCRMQNIDYLRWKYLGMAGMVTAILLPIIVILIMKSIRK